MGEGWGEGCLGHSRIINLRNVRVIHEGQGLALGFEPSDDLLGVHAQLDDLQRDPAADRLLLFGHIDHATTAFADLLKQFVAPNPIPGLFRGLDNHGFPSGGDGRAIHKQFG